MARSLGTQCRLINAGVAAVREAAKAHGIR
jgi:hypothetical protein